MIICEYCNKTFSNIYCLNTHKKSAKYCLKIQKEKGIYNIKKSDKIEEYECNICLKTFTLKNSLKVHLENICVKDIFKIHQIIKEKEDIIKKQQQIIQEKEDIIKDQNILIEKFKNDKHTLEEINNIYKSDHECIKEIAKQPKNITNNNKTLNLITPFNMSDKEQIKNKVDNNYNLNYIFSGQKGCAQFVLENIIKDDNGNLKYICSDPSRYIYKFKDQNGNIKKDIDAKQLTNLLVEGGLKKKAYDMANEWWTDEKGQTDTGKFEILMEKADSILALENDNTEFKKELAAITTL